MSMYDPDQVMTQALQRLTEENTVLKNEREMLKDWLVETRKERDAALAHNVRQANKIMELNDNLDWLRGKRAELEAENEALREEIDKK